MGNDRMKIEWTVIDEEALNQPWVSSTVYRRVPDGELIDYECNENPRNPINADGSVGFEFQQTVSGAANANEGSATVSASFDRLAAWDGTWANRPETIDPMMDACCRGTGERVPLTAKYRAQRDAFVRSRAQGGRAITNSSSCTPPGVPATLAHPILFELLFAKDRVTMLHDDGQVRRFWLDRSTHLPEDEQEYGYQGDSIARWDGDTLLVDTTAISSNADVFMANGIKVTRQTRVQERMRLLDAQTLQIGVVVTDPEIFSEPYEYTLLFSKVPGSFDVGCAQNNRDDGIRPVDLTPPR
jgi:hypothetical protein